MPGQLPLQRPPRLDVEGAVDRLVGDLHRLDRRGSGPAASPRSARGNGPLRDTPRPPGEARGRARAPCRPLPPRNAARPRALRRGRGSAGARRNGRSHARSSCVSGPAPGRSRGPIDRKRSRARPPRAPRSSEHSLQGARRALGWMPPVLARRLLTLPRGRPSRRPTSRSLNPCARSFQIASFVTSLRPKPLGITASPALVSETRLSRVVRRWLETASKRSTLRHAARAWNVAAPSRDERASPLRCLRRSRRTSTGRRSRRRTDSRFAKAKRVHASAFADDKLVRIETRFLSRRWRRPIGTRNRTRGVPGVLSSSPDSRRAAEFDSVEHTMRRHELTRPASHTPAIRTSGIHAGFCSGDGETRTRTGDTTIFSRVLYQLSYLASAEQG